MNEAAHMAEKTAAIIGDAATLALTIGRDALPIIQFVAGFFPGAAPVVQAVSVALPILEKISEFSPAVQEAIAGGASLAEAVTGVGDALVMPLKDLMRSIGVNPELMEIGVFLAGTFKRSQFTPQDPRFDRMGIGTQS